MIWIVIHKLWMIKFCDKKVQKLKKSPVHNCPPIFLEFTTCPDCIPWFVPSVISGWRHHHRCTWYVILPVGSRLFREKDTGSVISGNFVQYPIFMRKCPILSSIIKPYFFDRFFFWILDFRKSRILMRKKSYFTRS